MIRGRRRLSNQAVRLIRTVWGGRWPDLLARALPSSSLSCGASCDSRDIPGREPRRARAGAKSPPDGYTLLINTNAQAYSAALLEDLPYDPLKDFIPIVPLTRRPTCSSQARRAGVATVAELIAAARAKPGELKFGVHGIGTGTHIGVEKFNQAAGIKALHVPPCRAIRNADTIANAIGATSLTIWCPFLSPYPKFVTANSLR